MTLLVDACCWLVADLSIFESMKGVNEVVWRVLEMADGRGLLV